MSKTGSLKGMIDALRRQRTLKSVIASESDLQRLIHTNGTPLIDGTTAHFFVEHDSNEHISIIGDWNNWKPGVDTLEHINPKTTLYHLAKDFPADARLSYRIIIGDHHSINDPENPHTWQEVFGNNTYFTMPQYKGTKYLNEPGKNVKRGELQTFRAQSARGLEFERDVFVYIPETLRRNAKYRFIYVHDGEEAIRIGKFVNVFDNLRHHEPELPPVIAVFIPPVDRHAEYMLSEKFAKWCALSLVKQVEKHLGVRSEGRLRSMQGASLGGLCATFTGLEYPKVFGSIAAQSPSFWVGERRIIGAYSKKRKLPVRFFLHTGTIHDALTETRLMRNVLEEKRYDVTYVETSESHNWANWSRQYEAIIRWLANK